MMLGPCRLRVRLLTASLIVGTASMLSACEHQEGDPVTMADIRAEREPVEVVHGVNVKTSTDGRPRVFIEADVMRTYEEEDSSYVVLGSDSAGSRVIVRLFDERGQPSAVIEADQVMRVEDRGLYEARGDVEVVNVEGKRLESEELRWSEGERVIRTNTFVRIETPTERLEGYDLEASEDLETFRLERVTGRVTVREE